MPPKKVSQSRRQAPQRRTAAGNKPTPKKLVKKPATLSTSSFATTPVPTATGSTSVAVPLSQTAVVAFSLEAAKARWAQTLIAHQTTEGGATYRAILERPHADESLQRISQLKAQSPELYAMLLEQAEVSCRKFEGGSGSSLPISSYVGREYLTATASHEIILRIVNGGTAGGYCAHDVENLAKYLGSNVPTAIEKEVQAIAENPQHIGHSAVVSGLVFGNGARRSERARLLQTILSGAMKASVEDTLAKQVMSGEYHEDGTIRWVIEKLREARRGDLEATMIDDARARMAKEDTQALQVLRQLCDNQTAVEAHLNYIGASQIPGDNYPLQVAEQVAQGLTPSLSPIYISFLTAHGGRGKFTWVQPVRFMLHELARLAQNYVAQPNGSATPGHVPYEKREAAEKILAQARQHSTDENVQSRIKRSLEDPTGTLVRGIRLHVGL